MPDMSLKRAIITTSILLPSFLSSLSSNAQSGYDSRYNAVIPYNHRTLEAPPGMIYIPGGSSTIKYDQSSSDSNALKKVSLTSFFMDKTETTNQQYRNFTDWVIDSIAIVKYLKDDDLFLKDDNDTTATATATPVDTTAKVTDTSVHTAVVIPPAPGVTDTSIHTAAATVDTNVASKKRINWAKVDHDKIFDPSNTDYHTKLLPLLDENGNIKKDAYVFSYTYTKVFGTTNLKNNKKSERKTVPVNIYPDEAVWAQDLPNSQTEMYVENYFKAQPFDDYPVVGVNWAQASAFAYWRSITAGSYSFMPEYMDMYHLTYTLPSEAQWVYAAQGFYDYIVASDTVADTIPKLPSDSLVVVHDFSDSAVKAQAEARRVSDSTAVAQRAARAEQRKSDKKFNYYIADYLNFGKYGGKYGQGQPQGGVASSDTAFGDDTPVIDSSPVHFDKFGMLSNFKQDEGDYWEDGAALSTPSMSFAPNEFGLYNMEGNVSEWVMDAYSPSVYSFVSDLNPVLLYDADSSDVEAMKRKVIRGGSFMSNARALNPYYRDVELQNVAHCYLGFRCVMQAPEILHKNVSTRNRTVKGNRIKNRIFPELHLQEIH
jgi:formylglycine-generating enzyme required for sulfatase activity